MPITSRRTGTAAITEFVHHFQLRVIQEAITEGTTAYWRRRAATFEAARPRPEDFRGRATYEQLAATDARLAAIAEACRNKATFIDTYGLGLDVERALAVELAEGAA